MTGELNKEILDAVNTLPVEITFVDKDDTVQFSTKTALGYSRALRGFSEGRSEIQFTQNNWPD